MVAKATPAAPVVPAVPLVTELEAVIKKPYSVSIGAPCHLAFAEAAVHARNGFTFWDGPIEIAANGWAFFQMIQGQPDELAIQNAKASVELSAAAEERQYRKDVEAAARLILEEEKKAEAAKQRAKIEADHRKAIAALDASTAAAIAALN